MLSAVAADDDVRVRGTCCVSSIEMLRVPSFAMPASVGSNSATGRPMREIYWLAPTYDCASYPRARTSTTRHAVADPRPNPAPATRRARNAGPLC